MEKITSIVDLIKKIESDGKYKWLVIHAYFYQSVTPIYQTKLELIPYQLALDWMINWLDKYVNKGCIKNCNPMIDCLNSYIPNIQSGYPKYSLPPIL